MALFEGYERRIAQLQPVLDKYGFKDFEELKAYNNQKGVDAYKIVEGIQPIAFENAKWAYELGAAIALKKGVKTAAEAAKCLGEGLQAFCIPGSVADQRQVGLGHGNLGAMLLDEKTECFAFLAGHESFAAAEGAIGIARNANKVRTTPLRVILNGLGKDASMIISRINGFTYVQTKYDYLSADVKEDHALTVVAETAYSSGERARCAATARTTCARAWPSCGMRAWTFPSPATPPTPPASSTRSPAPIRRNAGRAARSTSPSPPAAARAVPCTRRIWAPAPPPTA